MNGSTYLSKQGLTNYDTPDYGELASSTKTSVIGVCKNKPKGVYGGFCDFQTKDKSIDICPYCKVTIFWTRYTQ